MGNIRINELRFNRTHSKNTILKQRNSGLNPHRYNPQRGHLRSIILTLEQLNTQGY